MSLANDILNTPDLTDRKPVDVKAWPHTKGKLFVRNMSGAEHEKFGQAHKNLDAGKPGNVKALVAVYTLVDESGNNIFRPDQIDEVAKKNTDALQDIVDAWVELRNANPSVEDQKKD